MKLILGINLLIFINYFELTSCVTCPKECTCTWFLTNLQVDCSNTDLNYPPDFYDLPIEALNLSYNNFKEFPKKLSKIETLSTLDLSHNQINYIESNALKGFTSLTKLILDYNNITNWNHINPRTLLLSVNSIKYLSLAGNPIYELPDNDDNNLLISQTLLSLNLNNCQIMKFTSQYFLKNLNSIKYFYLNNNPIRNLPQLISITLEYLYLSNCSLIKLQLNTFSYLSNLISLDLSKNSGLVLQRSLKSDEYLIFETIRKLDLSYCNMDRIDLINFPNLTQLKLNNNMIRQLNGKSFENSRNLEFLDLSHNSISEIELKTFSNLDKLRYLDLSYNAIPRIDNNLFKFNKQLINLNLSRNFLSVFNKIMALNLINLNLSWCEITTIELNAFDGLPHIKNIDLSNNLITKLPNVLHSETLEILNLSVCRLSSINNSTFSNFPELTSLDLSGNRFTTTFKVEHFSNNKYLQDIWLGDNPWRCECEDSSFFSFYLFLTQNPPKINDRLNIKCESPSYLYGKIWQLACFHEWFPSKKEKFTTEKIWTIIMVTIIISSILLCLVTTIQRILESRKKRRNQRERQLNLEEQRSIMRHNRLMLEQQAQLNAPDPRETNPPCYEEALLMPKLERNYKSMSELSSTRNKNRLTRSKTSNQMNDDNDLVLDSIKFLSEEMLSERDNERTININAIRRTGIIYQKSSRNDNLRMYNNNAGETRFPSSYFKAKNLESAEKIASFHSLERSPYSRRKPKPFNLNRNDDTNTSASTSDFTKIKRKSNDNKNSMNLLKSSDLIHSFSSIENSPYCQRKPKQTLHNNKNYSETSINEASSYSKNLNLIDDHFAKVSMNSYNGSSRCSSKIDLNDYQIMNSNDIELISVHSYKSDNHSDRSDPPVIVHHQSK